MTPEQISPKIDPTVFVAENATILGDVTIGADSSVWYGCIIRGDRSPVVIGQRSNVQDGCIIHEAPDHPTRIGDDVSLGHGAIVHGATVGDNVLVGIRAVLLNGSVVGDNCIIAAGAVVTPGTVIAPGSVVAGVPARVLRAAAEKDLALIRRTAANYVRYTRERLAAGDSPVGGPG